MKLFTTVKEIKSKEGELHFKRFAIIECNWFSIYIHTIYKEDEDEHYHDHPWNYASIILYGGFMELTKGSWRILTIGSISIQSAERVHKIAYLYSDKVTSLFFTGPRKREWGYKVKGEWIDNVTYRKLKNEGKLND